MAHPDHVVRLQDGAASWNRWRGDHPDIVPDLRVAHLGSARLRDKDLSRAMLSVAVLKEADLRRANLRGADLSSANLHGAILCEADLRRADLRGARLTGADLRRADLGDVDLRSGLLYEADLEDADLSGADLGSTLVYNARNLTVEQLCSASSLWLTELHDRMPLAEQHCPHLLQRPPTQGRPVGTAS